MVASKVQVTERAKANGVATRAQEGRAMEHRPQGRGQIACRQRAGTWYEAAAITAIRTQHRGDPSWHIADSLPSGGHLSGGAVYMVEARERDQRSATEAHSGATTEVSRKPPTPRPQHTLPANTVAWLEERQRAWRASTHARR